MRGLLLPGMLSLMLVSTAALGQNDPSGRFQGLFAEYLETCMKDWDAGTRMTKKEWSRTCRRLANQRAKFRIEHGFAPKSTNARSRGVCFTVCLDDEIGISRAARHKLRSSENLEFRKRHP